ncbi:MAG: hypothetical protein ACO3N7_03615 [Kiritimatiellia bacterium]
MSRSSHSLFFFFGIICMLMIWLTSPFWAGSADKDTTVKRSESPASSPRRFLYAGPDSNAARFTDDTGNAYEVQQLKRQLNQRARMEQSGFVKNVIENPEMPEAVRSRFRKEKERLDALAQEHPDLAAEADQVKIPRQLADDGSFTPEFRQAVEMMKSSGVWDEMHTQYLRRLEAAAKDESLPPEERPTREDIETFRSGKHIPAL